MLLFEKLINVVVVNIDVIKNILNILLYSLNIIMYKKYILIITPTIPIFPINFLPTFLALKL